MKRKLEKISLRQKKFASLKLKILECLMEKIESKTLEEVSVKEIAQELEISEMTFYNYFKNKKELIIYFIELWNIEMNQVLLNTKTLSSIEAIFLIYKLTAIKIESNYRFMMEIIAFIALNGTPKKDLHITDAEIILRFGSLFSFQEGGFKELLLPLLNSAIKNKEIKSRDTQTLFIALHNTFFGTPLFVDAKSVGELQTLYKKQLVNILDMKGKMDV